MADIVWLPPIKASPLRAISLIDVMEAFLMWNRTEKPLYDRLHRQEKVNYPWFNDVLTAHHYSGVFPKSNRQGQKEQKILAELCAQFKESKNNLDYVTVFTYEIEKYTARGVDKKTCRPLGAASQIMWYMNREDILIYDAASRKSLHYLLQEHDIEGDFILQSDIEENDIMNSEDEPMDVVFDMDFELSFNLDSYYDYYQCWIDIFLDYVSDIQIMCDDLYRLCDYEGVPEEDDYQCLQEDWFYRKVFAVWLRSISKKLPRI